MLMEQRVGSERSVLKEMGLKHPEKVFDGRFNEWTREVEDLDMRILPREMEFPSGEVRTYEQMFMSDKQIEKAVKNEVKEILNQFKKGAQDFGKLTREKRSTFMALGAMVFPENPDLAEELAVEMRLEGKAKKPPGPDARENVREEEAVFQKIPVVSGENCLLAAGLRQMAERRYKDKGNQTVSTVAQLINWNRKEADPPVELTEHDKAWLDYRSLNQYLSGGGGGIRVILDEDKSWNMMAKDEIDPRKISHNGKGTFKIEGNMLITEGVSIEDFIKITKAARPPLSLSAAARLSGRVDEAEVEEDFDLDLLFDSEERDDKGIEVRPEGKVLVGNIPAAPVLKGEEEYPDWFRRLQEQGLIVQKVPEAEAEKPAKEIDLSPLPYGPELGPGGDEEPVQTADIVVDKARSLAEGKYCVTVSNLGRIGTFENLQKELRQAIGDKQVSELVIEGRAWDAEVLDFLLAAKDWDDYNLCDLVDQAKSFKDNLSFTKELTREELLGYYRRNVEISNAFYGRYDLPDKIGDGLWKEIEMQVWPEEKRSEQSRIRLY